jgi:hypothetical protein
VALLDDGTAPPRGQHHASRAPEAGNGYGLSMPTGHAAPRAQG